MIFVVGRGNNTDQVFREPAKDVALFESGGLNAPEARSEPLWLSSGIQVRVLDTEAQPISGASIRFGVEYADFYATDVVEIFSDRGGFGVGPPGEEVDWAVVMVTKDGYAVEFVTRQDQENDEILVVLDRLEELVVFVSDLDGRAIVGADVNVRGRWGEEARIYESEKGRYFWRHEGYSDGVTGSDGSLRVLVDPNEAYRIRASFFGYTQQEVVVEPGQKYEESLKVVLYPILGGGVSIPRELSGSARMCGESVTARDGFSTLRMTKKNRRAFEAELEARLGLGNTFWKFVVDRRPAAKREPVYKRTRFRLFPGSPTSQFDLPLKRVGDELNPWDIVQADSPVRKLTQVDVEFRDQLERPVMPSSSFWGLVDGKGFKIVSLAEGLPPTQCPDFSAGRYGYRFMVPEGEYSVKVIEPLISLMQLPEFEPVLVHAHQGLRRSFVVSLNKRNAKVQVECVDELGREVKEYRVHFYCLNVSGRPDDRTCFVRVADGPMTPVAILPGRCFVEVEAFGYARQLFEYDLSAGQIERIVVQLEVLTDEWQNSPKMTPGSLVK